MHGIIQPAIKCLANSRKQYSILDCLSPKRHRTGRFLDNTIAVSGSAAESTEHMICHGSQQILCLILPHLRAVFFYITELLQWRPEVQLTRVCCCKLEHTATSGEILPVMHSHGEKRVHFFSALDIKRFKYFANNYDAANIFEHF